MSRRRADPDARAEAPTSVDFDAVAPQDPGFNGAGLAQEAPQRRSLFDVAMRSQPSPPLAQHRDDATSRDHDGEPGIADQAPDAETLLEGPQGHRKRLRARFMQGGPDALPDYELLEMILFRVFQRGDTKPLAKRLINRFGSFAEVINAAPDQLIEVQGLGARGVEELKLIRASTVRVMHGEIRGKPILASWAAVLNYCRAAQAFDLEERFRILFLDKRNQLIADEVQSSGTIDHTPVYIREVVHRALTHRASAMILVHNHPSGDPTPSKADIAMTNAISSASRPLGISVHDHIIVGREGHVSFKTLKLI